MLKKYILILFSVFCMCFSDTFALPILHQSSRILQNFLYFQNTDPLQISNVTVNAGGDTEINVGDTVILSIDINNTDNQAYRNCLITFNIIDPFIELIDSSEYFEYIAPENEYQLNNAIRFIVSPSTPNAHIIEFNISIQAESETFYSTLNFTVSSFDLSIADYYFTDGSDDILLANEYNIFYINILNNYYQDVNNVRCELSCTDTLIHILGNSAFIQTLSANNLATCSFVFQTGNSFQNNEIVDFIFDIYVDNFFNKRKIITYNAWVGAQTCFDLESNNTTPVYTFADTIHGWTIDTINANSGVHALSSDSIGANEETTIQCEVSVSITSPISFFHKVSSEINYDFLNFYINGELIHRWSGITDWEYFSCDVPAGNMLFSWSYSKDGNVDRGEDKAWIDDICLPEESEVASLLSINPQEVIVYMGLNQTAEFPLIFTAINPIFILFENEIFDESGAHISWVTIDYPNGSLKPSSTKELKLFFNSTNKLIGQSYHATLYCTITNGEILQIPITMNVGESSIQENEFEEISPTLLCFPNPVESTLQLSITNSNYPIKQIEIYDISGKLLMQEIGENFQCSIDFSKMKAAIYFVKVKTASGYQFMQKVIKF